jgi:hypothetical protein
MRTQIRILPALAAFGLTFALSMTAIKAADTPTDPYWSKYWQWYHLQYTPYYWMSYGRDYPNYGIPGDAYNPYPYSFAYGYPEYTYPEYYQYWSPYYYPYSAWYNGPRSWGWEHPNAHRSESRFHYGWR